AAGQARGGHRLARARQEGGALRAAAVSVHEPRPDLPLAGPLVGGATPVRGRRSPGTRRRRPRQDPAFLARSPELTRRTLGTMEDPRGARAGAGCPVRATRSCGRWVPVV